MQPLNKTNYRLGENHSLIVALGEIHKYNNMQTRLWKIGGLVATLNHNKLPTWFDGATIVNSKHKKLQVRGQAITR